MGDLVRLGNLLPEPEDTTPIVSERRTDSSELASVLGRLAKMPCRICRRPEAACTCKAGSSLPIRRGELPVDREHQGAKLEDFDPRTRELALAAIERSEEFRGGLMTGSPGTGKTRLLVALCQREHEAGKRVHFYLARRFFRRLSAVYAPNPSEREQAVIDDLSHCDLLAIDDLGHEGKPSDFVLGALHEIVQNRHGNYRPTLVSTNLALAEIAARYDDAIASRLGSWLPIVMAGEDRRA